MRQQSVDKFMTLTTNTYQIALCAIVVIAVYVMDMWLRFFKVNTTNHTHVICRSVHQHRFIAVHAPIVSFTPSKPHPLALNLIRVLSGHMRRGISFQAMLSAVSLRWNLDWFIAHSAYASALPFLHPFTHAARLFLSAVFAPLKVSVNLWPTAQRTYIHLNTPSCYYATHYTTKVCVA